MSQVDETSGKPADVDFRRFCGASESRKPRIGRWCTEGAYVFITGRRENELSKAAQDIGRDVMSVQGDVASLPDLDRLSAQIQKEKGHLDILFANVGAARYGRLAEITEDLYTRDLSPKS